MQVIYIDTLFLTNFIINYLILLSTAKICSVRASRLRMAGGAALGGAYSVLVVFPMFGFLLSPWVKITAGILMMLSVFCGAKGLFRIGVVFFAVSALFAGVVVALSLLGAGSLFDGTSYIPVTLKILLPAFAVSYAAVSLAFRRMGRRAEGMKMSELRIELEGRSVKMAALLDTGNSLTDPITGRPVIVVEAEAVSALFDRRIQRLIQENLAENPVEFLEKLNGEGMASRFRLIPYTAVGVSGGFLLGFKPDKIIIDGEEKQGMIALSPTAVSDGGIYSALVNGGI